MSQPRHPTGFTLLEVLAAAALLGMALAVAVSVLASSADAARASSLSADLHDLDRRARLHAMAAGGDVILTIERAAARLTPVANGEQLSSCSIPPTAQVELTTIAHEPIHAIRIDHRGRSIDYRITVTVRPAAPPHRWIVAGLTGWIDRERLEAQP